MSKKLNETAEWLALEQHAQEISLKRIESLFDLDSDRFCNYSIQTAGLLYDYSKHKVDSKAIRLLLNLARTCELPDWISRQFSGEKINTTEQRSVLHSALRRDPENELELDGKNIMPAVEAELEHMQSFVDSIHSGRWQGASGRPIKTIINIGIGGSHLGPEMVCKALRPYWQSGIDVRFVANVDPAHIAEVLRGVEADSTLFIIASKTFTTQETMTNAGVARDWVIESMGDESSVARHFVAVSTNTEAVMEFGIKPENMFQFWDWVGGRFSLWSVIGLPIALAIGMDGFRNLLSGARAMDEHFQNQPLEHNMPVLMGLIGIWCRNFLQMPTLAIIPYSENLSLFSAYLQQGEMESNGKHTTRDGLCVDWQTAPVIWGEPGTNGQHAFFQLLHQGTQVTPVDFILLAHSSYNSSHQHELLLANALAQSCALMQGKTADQVRAELSKGEVDNVAIDNLVNHRSYQGDRPSSTIVMDQLDPQTLGALIALYEHKIFVQGVIWQICSYDQWGVELGKKVAKKVEGLFDPGSDKTDLDGSTRGLLDYLLNHKS